MKKISLIIVGICFALLLTQFIVSESDSSSKNFYDKQKIELTNKLNNNVQESKFYVSTDSITGKVKFIGSELSNAIVHPSSFDINSATSEDSARQFLSDYGNYLGIRSKEDKLSLISSKNLEDGRAVVRMQQEYDNVPVFGGEIIVQMNSKKSIISVGSKLMPDLNVNMGYNLDAGEASENALNAVAKYYDVDSSSLQTTTPELWIYDPRVFGENNVFIKNPVLVWRMNVYSDDLFSPINELTLVNANSGKMVLHFTQIYTAKYRKVYDKNNTRDDSLPGSTLVRVEGGDASEITDANNAYTYAGDTYDFYYTHFDRDSIDDLGMNLTSTVRFCYEDIGEECPYENAFWNGEQMTYGDGFASADDVVAHEMSHGVTEHESNLFYYMQSGAINEAFSDIMGEFVDLTNNAGNDSDEARWLMGEDLSIGAIRSASDPLLFGDPDSMNSTNYYCDTEDNGGVHWNSGVANKAAYLITDGANFSGYNITGIGINKTAELFYEVNTNLLTSGSDYNDLYDALIQAAINLDFNSSEKLTVEKAINATQMNKESVCNITEAPICSSGTINDDIFFDNLENISSGYWTAEFYTGSLYGFYYPQNPNDYDTDSTYATSGDYNIWGDDPDEIIDSYIEMNSNVSLQAETDSYMYFKHAYDFEEGGSWCYDGGVIEYSVDGGINWTDGGNLIINNNYTGTIDNGFNNPLADRSAFCGVSHGYTSSRLNLSSLAGQNVRFRFRIGADESGGDYGWFIDDIRIYTCIADTIAPVIHLITPADNIFQNTLNTTHSFNVTDDSGPANCTLFWSTGVGSQNFYPVSVDGNTQDAGTLTSSDGITIWYVNCTDDVGNTGMSEVRNFTIDTILPVLNSTSSSPSSTTATISYTSNESVNATINYGTNINLSSNSSSSSYSNSSSILLSGLTASTFYYYNITICDQAANCVTNGTTYNFTTSATPLSSGGGGGGSSTTTKEYSPSNSNLLSGYTQELKKGDKIKFTFLNNQLDTHRVSLDNLSTSLAYITITSEPLSLVLEIGKERKINISSSTHYQLSLKLNSIKNNKVNLTIKEINELIPVKIIPTSVNTTLNPIEEQNKTKETEKNTDINGRTNILNNERILICAGVLIVGGIVCLVCYLRKNIGKKRKKKTKLKISFYDPN